jgi:hypothetical protein
MVSTLDYLAGCKFGLDMGANRARDAFIWRCLVWVGAMRGVVKSYYYRVRRLSDNRLTRSAYNAFDATVPDFDIPAPPTSSERLRRPSRLPRGVSPIAHSDLAARSPSRRLLPTGGCPLEPHIIQFLHAWPHHMGGDILYSNCT